jgi:hypothetical protein
MFGGRFFAAKDRRSMFHTEGGKALLFSHERRSNMGLSLARGSPLAQKRYLNINTDILASEIQIESFFF